MRILCTVADDRRQSLIEFIPISVGYTIAYRETLAQRISLFLFRD